MLYGDFQTAGLPDIIQVIVQNRKTGLLTVVKKNDEKSLYFSEGSIAAASSRHEEHLIGKILLSKQYITEEQLDKALNFKQETGLKLGEVLKHMKIIDEEILQKVLKIQMEEIFLSLFQWVEAEFSFVDIVLHQDDIVKTRLDVTGLMLDTAVKTDEWNRIKKVIPDLSGKLRILPVKKGSPVKIRKKELQVLKKTEKNCTIKDICEQLKMPEIETLKIIHSLILRNIAEYKEAEPQENAHIPGL